MPVGDSNDQQKIWQHFQNADPESFAAAHPRLAWLVRQIGRRTRAASPAVLNIGIGDGFFERQARDRRWDIHSLDPDEQAVRRLADEGIAAQVGTIERIPLADGAMHAVVASEVLEHLTDQQRRTGLSEIARVLRPGGWFLGTVPHDENLAEQRVVCPHCGKLFHRWGHQQAFDLPALRRELTVHFRIERLGRTAFVEFRGGGLRRVVKSLLRVALAQLGEPIAVPTIYWIARKKS